MYVEQTGQDTLHAEFLETQTVTLEEEVIELTPEIPVKESRSIRELEVTFVEDLEAKLPEPITGSVPVPVREIEASLADNYSVDFVSVLEIYNNQGKQNSVKISAQALQNHYCIIEALFGFG